jgi:hypothetical protein
MFSVRIDRVLGFEHGFPPAYALVVALMGLGFLLFGWRLHRVTVVVCGFLIGAFIGQLFARWMDVDRAWGVFVGGAAFALLADPLYRVVIFILSGVALGIGLGETVRITLAPGGFLWGFVPGFLAGGAFSLWKIKWVVIFSTAFLGAMAFWWGLAVALCAWVFADACAFHSNHPVLGWILLGLAFLAGCVVQVRFSSFSDKKEEEEEEKDEQDGEEQQQR